METEVKIGIRSVWSCVLPSSTPRSAQPRDIDRGRRYLLLQKSFWALFLICAILVVSSQAADVDLLDLDFQEFDNFDGNNEEGGQVNVIDENNRARVARSIFDVPIFGTGSDEITCPEDETRSFVEALGQWICMSSNDSNNNNNRKNSNNNTGNTTTTNNSTSSNNSRLRPLRKSSG